MTRLLAVVVLAACSGRAPAPGRPTPDVAGTGSGTGRAPPDAPPTDPRPSEADCHAMIDHVIAIDVAERPADQQPVAAELAKVRADMRAELVPTCRDLAKPLVACITTAATRAAIAECK